MQQGRQDKRNYFSVCRWQLGVWRPGHWGCSRSDGSWQTLLGIHLHCVPAVQMSSVSVGASRSYLLHTPCITLSWAAPEVLLQRCLQTPAVPLGNCSGGGMGGVSGWNRAPGEREELMTAGFVLPFCIATWKAIAWEGLEDRVFCLFLH